MTTMVFEKRFLLKFFLFLLLLDIVVPNFVWALEKSSSPERISFILSAAKDEFFPESYKLSLQIKNESRIQTTLYVPSSFKGEVDFKQYLGIAASFETNPSTTCGQPIQQIDLLPRVGYPPSIVLSPGENFLFKRQIRKRRLDDYSHCFPSDGAYEVKVLIDLTNAYGELVHLVSNSVTLTFGGSFKSPVPGEAKIISSRPKEKTVILNIGALSGFKVGDHFKRVATMGLVHDFYITEVDEKTSTAHVDTTLNLFKSDSFPPVGASVYLWNDIWDGAP